LKKRRVSGEPDSFVIPPSPAPSLLLPPAPLDLPSPPSSLLLKSKVSEVRDEVMRRDAFASQITEALNKKSNKPKFEYKV
jgi:hypothetical protein